MRRDLACGVCGLALAAAYFAAAARLPTSFLADEVGADGAPKLLAVALAALGALLIARAMLIRSPSAATGIAIHARAAGIMAIGIVYAFATPWLGYLPATCALIFASAVYAGVAPSWRAAAISGAGGLVLWFCFVKLLGVAMPSGMLG